MPTPLTTAELDLTRTVPHGAPYITGDRIAVEHKDRWHEADVIGVERLASGRFGLVWRLRVRIDIGGSATFTNVQVDDNGRNHTWRQQVCPL